MNVNYIFCNNNNLLYYVTEPWYNENSKLSALVFSYRTHWLKLSQADNTFYIKGNNLILNYKNRNSNPTAIVSLMKYNKLIYRTRIS
jgi:hypothetical protein